MSPLVPSSLCRQAKLRLILERGEEKMKSSIYDTKLINSLKKGKMAIEMGKRLPDKKKQGKS